MGPPVPITPLLHHFIPPSPPMSPRACYQQFFGPDYFRIYAPRLASEDTAMVFGSPARFAIECKVAWRSGRSVYVTMCLRAAGEPVGESTEVMVLVVPLGFYRDSPTFSGQRDDPFIQKKTDAEVLGF